MLTAGKAVTSRAWVTLPQLIAWFLLGYLVHEVFLALAAKVAPIHPLLGAAILPIALLGTLGSWIGMLQTLRPAIPSAPTGLGAATRKSDRDLDLVGLLTASVVPFVVFYTAWKYLLNDYQSYVFLAFNNSFDAGAESPEDFVRPVVLTMSALTLATVVVVLLIRTVLKRFRGKLPRWVVFVEYYLEALWVYLLIGNWLGNLNIKTWLETRRFVVWANGVRADLMAHVPPLEAVWNAGAWLVGQVVAVFAVPLGWLAIAGVVYALTPAVSWDRTRKLINQTPAGESPVVQRTAESSTTRVLSWPFRSQLTALRDAIYVIAHVGILPISAYVLCYTVLVWIFGNSTETPDKPGWLNRVLSVWIGPHDTTWWSAWGPALNIVPDRIFQILLMCLVVTVYSTYVAAIRQHDPAQSAQPEPQ